MRLGLLITLFAAFAVGAGSYAAAATLGVSSGTLGGSGAVAVSSCDADGVTVSQRDVDTSASHNVTSMVLTGINAACNGATLTVTLTDSTGAALVTGSVAVTASGTATVAFSGSDAAASIKGYRFALAGP